MKACDNCLDPIDVGTGSAFPVGHERGTQRDPYHASLDLCWPCQRTLGGTMAEESTVDVAGFHARFVAAREVTR